MNDGSTKIIKLTADVEFHEGIEQDFEGDFPNIEEYYKIVKPYFARVIGED